MTGPGLPLKVNDAGIRDFPRGERGLAVACRATFGALGSAPQIRVRKRNSDAAFGQSLGQYSDDESAEH